MTESFQHFLFEMVLGEGREFQGREDSTWKNPWLLFFVCVCYCSLCVPRLNANGTHGECVHLPLWLRRTTNSTQKKQQTIVNVWWRYFLSFFSWRISLVIPDFSFLLSLIFGRFRTSCFFFLFKANSFLRAVFSPIELWTYPSWSVKISIQWACLFSLARENNSSIRPRK